MVIDIKKYGKKTIQCVLLFVFLKYFYQCPIKFFTGFDCPGCGLTRAFSSVLILDFQSAFDYHPLFWLIGIEVVYVLFGEAIQMNKRIELYIGIITIVLLIVVWIYRKYKI